MTEAPTIFRIADTASKTPDVDHSPLVAALLGWAATHTPTERSFVVSELRSVRDNPSIHCLPELRQHAADLLDALEPQN